MSTARGAAACLLALALACARSRASPDEGTGLAPAAPARAAAPVPRGSPGQGAVLGRRPGAAASPPGEPVSSPTDLVEYVLDPGSDLHFTLGAGSRRVQGDVRLAQGRFAFDPREVGRTRGRAIVDLATLHLEASRPGSRPGGSRSGAWELGGGRDPERADPAPTLTRQALWWLELAPESTRARHPEHRYAQVTLLQVQSEAGATAVAGLPVRASRPDRLARRLPLLGSGELVLHGVRTPHTARLLATFEWSQGTPESEAPVRIELATAAPLRVDLMAHGVLPRDGRGHVIARAAAELRRSRAASIEVSLRWALDRAEAGEVGASAQTTHLAPRPPARDTQSAEGALAPEAAER